MLKLVIANKNYSTWSLRPWLLLKAFAIPFEEIQLSLLQTGLKERFGAFSPTGRVPVLIDGDLTVWDSLAICETVSERWLNGQGWPDDSGQRAIARSLCAEMHSGFTGLRGECPMNLRACRTQATDLRHYVIGYGQSVCRPHSAVREWVAAAALETEIIPEDEAGIPVQVIPL